MCYGLDCPARLAILFLVCAANFPSCAKEPGRDHARVANAPESAQNAATMNDPDSVAGAYGRELEAMIEALANRVNTAPTIEGFGSGSPVLFKEEYDHGEQRRVLTALRALNRRDGNELWGRLVAHVDDDRYALTWVTETGGLNNMSVGNICSYIAIRDLELVYERLSPTTVALYRTVHLVRAGRNFVDPDYVAWCAAHKGKELYQMQIELCEWTLTDPEALEKLTPAQRDEYTEKATKEIARLKETRQPVTEPARFDDRQGGGPVSTLSAEQIERYRDEARKGPASNRRFGEASGRKAKRTRMRTAAGYSACARHERILGVARSGRTRRRTRTEIGTTRKSDVTTVVLPATLLAPGPSDA